jgi:hypothetical protein
VTYSELTQDDAFWAGCKSCVNYEILVSKERKNCMCTAMLYDPKDHYEPEETTQDFKKHSKLYERFMRIKQWKLLAPFLKHHAEDHSGSNQKTGSMEKAGNGGGRARSLFHMFFHL